MSHSPAACTSACSGDDEPEYPTEVKHDAGFRASASIRRNGSHTAQTISILSSRLREASISLSTAQDGMVSFDRQLNHLHGILETARNQMDKSFQGHKELSKQMSLSQRSDTRTFELRRRSTRDSLYSNPTPMSDSIDSP